MNLNRRTFIGTAASFVVAAPLLTTARPVSAQTVPTFVNPSFETPALGSGWQFTPTNAGWTFVGRSGIQGNGSVWHGGPAPDGTQTGVIQNTGTISQTISFPSGGNYTLRFIAQGRSDNDGSNPIKVTLDGVQIGLVTPSGLQYETFNMPFTVTAGDHIIQFAGMNTAGDRATFIDAVEIVTGTINPPPPVPPPSSEGTLVLGPGGAGNIALGPSSLAGGYASKTEVDAASSIAFGGGARTSYPSAVAIGRNAKAMMYDSFALGQNCQAYGDNGRAWGWACLNQGNAAFAHGYQSWDRGITGLEAYSAGSFGTGTEDIGSATAQTCRAVFRVVTQGAITDALTTDGRGSIGFNNTNQLILPDHASYIIQWLVVARAPATGDTAAWKVFAMVTRGNGAGTVVIFPPDITDIANTPGADAWDVSLSVDTRGGVSINGTGEAGKTIQWVAVMIDAENVG